MQGMYEAVEAALQRAPGLTEVRGGLGGRVAARRQGLKVAFDDWHGTAMPRLAHHPYLPFRRWTSCPIWAALCATATCAPCSSPRSGASAAADAADVRRCRRAATPGAALLAGLGGWLGVAERSSPPPRPQVMGWSEGGRWDLLGEHVHALVDPGVEGG